MQMAEKRDVPQRVSSTSPSGRPLEGISVVEFATIDDLERIVKVMNPAAPDQEPAE